MPAIRGQRTRSSRRVNRAPRIPALPDVPVTTMLMGCSTSDHATAQSSGFVEHGGTEEWDGWRTYRENDLYTFSNRTGLQRPKFMAYSKAGANIGGASPVYSTVFNEVKADLDAYYYTGGASSTTHSARWGIKLYWSNGNENHDKGALALPHTPTGITNYTTSMRGLYDACHFIETNAGPTLGQRRYPDAYSGSNPTHFAEMPANDLVQDWLMPSAPYHDFVMWSMYPPGRESSSTDPIFDWSSFDDADWDVLNSGFLTRCYRRTKLAQDVAGHPVAIGTGEIGIGNDPNDNTHRPYYAVYGMVESMLRLQEQYSLEQPFACWWDNQTAIATADNSQNILTDEDPATSPSTVEAWRHWPLYNAYRGGTKPGSWAGTPKAAWVAGAGTDDRGTAL